MRKGDVVIADNPESSSSRLTRSFGTVLEITQAGSVLIELADGSVIKRQGNSDFFHHRQAMFANSSGRRRQ